MKGVLAAVGAATLLGCNVLAPPPTDNTAVADIRDARGVTIGAANISEVTGGLRIIIEVKGLPPGQKGVHIHEVGACDPPDFTSAGDHFNPHGKRHGLLNSEGPHAGDLPNITIAADGRGRLETLTDRVTLAAGPASIVDADGSAFVIHARPDDFRTDPAGDAGARVACGVITTSASRPRRR